MELTLDDIGRLNNWVSDMLPDVDSSNPISTHVDRILLHHSVDRMVFDSILLYQKLVELLAELDTPVQPVLVIPLGGGRINLMVDVPSDFVEMCEDLDKNEFPSLYLLSWIPSRQGVICEEYSVPIQFPIGLSGEEHYVYYREFRYGLAIQNNWEFSRAVYVKFFPDKLHVQ